MEAWIWKRMNCFDSVISVIGGGGRNVSLYMFKSKAPTKPSNKTSISLNEWLKFGLTLYWWAWHSVWLFRQLGSTECFWEPTNSSFWTFTNPENILFDSDLQCFVSYLLFFCLFSLQIVFERFRFILQVLFFSLAYTKLSWKASVQSERKQKREKVKLGIFHFTFTFFFLIDLS